MEINGCFLWASGYILRDIHLVFEYQVSSVIVWGLEGNEWGSWEFAAMRLLVWIEDESTF